LKKNVKENGITIIYFTDPTCSWCWATEAKVRRLLEEYGHQIQIVYKMGGLLEKWTGYQNPEENINRPAQMAPRWVDVSDRTGMPIDERIWREDPPLSTFPACIAFKAAEFQGTRLAVRYLRRLREAVFLERKNTSREEVLFRLAKQVGFQMARFRKDYKEGRAESAFRQDLEDAREQFILGFPTFLFRSSLGREAKLYGYREYEGYQQALDDVCGSPLKRSKPSSLLSFLNKYDRVLLAEVTEVFGLDPEQATQRLESLRKEKKVRREAIGKGNFFWSSRARRESE